MGEEQAPDLVVSFCDSAGPVAVPSSSLLGRGDRPGARHHCYSTGTVVASP
jgi:hypothetical protein